MSTDTAPHSNSHSNTQHITIYTRDGCHLCEQVTGSLFALQDELSLKLHFIDIDEDLELVKKYNADVPVVMHDNTVLFRHFFDETTLRQALIHE